MSDRSWTVLTTIAAILAVLALIFIFVLPSCGGSIETAAGGTVPMKCHWTFCAEIPIAILLILTAVGQFFLKGTEARRLSALFIIAVAVVAFLMTTNVVIGICAMPGMACRTMAKFCRLDYILLILIGMIQFVIAGNKNHHKREF